MKHSLIKAVKKFRIRDRYLIDINAKEEAINFRIGLYLNNGIQSLGNNDD